MGLSALMPPGEATDRGAWLAIATHSSFLRARLQQLRTCPSWRRSAQAAWPATARARTTALAGTAPGAARAAPERTIRALTPGARASALARDRTTRAARAGTARARST